MLTQRPGGLSCVNVTGEFGIIIRRHALVERDVSLHSILEVLGVAGRSDKQASRAWSGLLVYFDDFFEFVGAFLCMV